MGREALQPGEETVAKESPSWRLFLGELTQAIVIFLVTILPAVFFPDFGPDPIFFGASAVVFEAVFLVPRIVKSLIHALFTTYILTTDRVYARTEFFSTDLKVVPYEKVTLVQLHRGLFERLFGIAEVRLFAYQAGEGHIRMRGLRDPRPIFNLARERLRVHNTAEAIVRSD